MHCNSPEHVYPRIQKDDIKMHLTMATQLYMIHSEKKDINMNSQKTTIFIFSCNLSNRITIKIKIMKHSHNDIWINPDK